MAIFLSSAPACAAGPQNGHSILAEFPFRGNPRSGLQDRPALRQHGRWAKLKGKVGEDKY
jgi:hypothetical protein